MISTRQLETVEARIAVEAMHTLPVNVHALSFCMIDEELLALTSDGLYRLSLEAMGDQFVKVMVS